MSKVLSACQIYKSHLHLELLPVLAFGNYFDINHIQTMRQSSAAIVNVSGRQRMLCQRTALLSLQLVYSQNKVEWEKLHSCLLETIELMEKSHNGLLYGDSSMSLSGQSSEIIQQMYFEPPLNLDQQIRSYITEVKAVLQTPKDQLTPNNSHISYIQNAALGNLLTALDSVVSQYHKESDAEQLEIDINQATLYEQTCTAMAVAKAKAQQLEKTLQDLQQTQSQLIQTEKISGLGQLVAGVAHEINNPVNFISGNLNHASNYVDDLLNLLHLYQEEYPHPSPAIQQLIENIEIDFLIQDLPEVLSSMKIGAERISQIVLNLSSFSRLEEARMKPVNIHEGLDCTLLILKNRLKGGGKYSSIQVMKEYGNLPLVECYAGQLNQVFMNIISNAIDALNDYDSQRSTEEIQNQSCQIKIRTEVSSSDTVTIRIADNGSGMSEEVKMKLFEPFFTTKPQGKGTGLGLSISSKIVGEKHNGSLQCNSKLGQGTEFLINLPIKQPEKLYNDCVIPLDYLENNKVSWLHG